MSTPPSGGIFEKWCGCKILMMWVLRAKNWLKMNTNFLKLKVSEFRVGADLKLVWVQDQNFSHFCTHRRNFVGAEHPLAPPGFRP